MHEFFAEVIVQHTVNGKADEVTGSNGEVRPLQKREQVNTLVSHFSFGPRRFASKGPRRLFVLQKCVMSSVFEPEVKRPNALLRVVSTCA